MKKNIKLISLLVTAILLVGAVIGISVSAEEDTTPGVRIAGQNMAYEGAVQVLYLVETKNAEGYTPKLLISNTAFEVTDAIPEGVTVKECPTDAEGNPLTVTANGKTYYAIFSDGIGAKDMRVALYATPILANENGEIVAGKQTVYSPWQYAVNRFDATPTEAQFALYTAMLDYAASVQDLFMTEAEIATAGGWADAYYKLDVYHYSAGQETLKKAGEWTREASTFEAEPSYDSEIFAGFTNGSQGDFEEYRFYTAKNPGTTKVVAKYVSTNSYNGSASQLPVANIKGDFKYVTNGSYATPTDVDTDGDGLVDSLNLVKKNGGGATIGVDSVVTQGDYFVAEFDLSDFAETKVNQVVQFLVNFTGSAGSAVSKSQITVRAETFDWGMTTNESRVIKTVTYDKTNNTYTATHKTAAETATGAFTTLHSETGNVRLVIVPTLIEREYTYYETETIDGNTTTSAGETRKCSYYAPKLTIYVNGEEKYTFYSSQDTWRAVADENSEYGYSVTNAFDTAVRDGSLALYNPSKASDSARCFYIFSTKDSGQSFTVNDVYVTARSYNDEIVRINANSYDFEAGDEDFYKTLGAISAANINNTTDGYRQPPYFSNAKNVGNAYTAIVKDGDNSYLQMGGGAHISRIHFDNPITDENIKSIVFETDIKVLMASNYIKDTTTTDSWIARIRMGDAATLSDSTDSIRFFLTMQQSTNQFSLSTSTKGGTKFSAATSSTYDPGTPDDTADDFKVRSSAWVRLKVVYTNNGDGKAGTVAVYAAPINADGNVGNYAHMCASAINRADFCEYIKTFHIDIRGGSYYKAVHLAVDNTKLYYICE